MRGGESVAEAVSRWLDDTAAAEAPGALLTPPPPPRCGCQRSAPAAPSLRLPALRPRRLRRGAGGWPAAAPGRRGGRPRRSPARPCRHARRFVLYSQVVRCRVPRTCS